MRTIYLQKDCPADLAASVATIGFFDGVHRGHQFLISHVVETAREEGRQSMIITFDQHPREVLHADYQPRLLTPLQEKLYLLERTGVDVVAVLHFDVALSQLSARDFMHDLLLERLHVANIFIGDDHRFRPNLFLRPPHRFGHNRAEGFADYVAYGREMGMEVVQNPVFELEGVNVSSTVCRRHVAAGEMEAASRCLGYPYRMGGRVVAGFQEGRKLGFPTANIQLADPRRLVPASGVYAVRVEVGDEATWRLGMMNIGTRPTFGGEKVSLEVHIFDFAGDLYGCQVEVAFLRRVREERKFASPEELAAQLARDKQAILDACCLS